MTNNTTELPPLATVKQVAAYLGCSIAHILNQPIEHVKIGRIRRYRREAVLAFIDTLTVSKACGGKR